MALDAYGNQRNYGLNPNTDIQGGTTTAGASANYGGSAQAYQNEAARLKQGAGGYQNQAQGSFGDAMGARNSQQSALGLLQGAAMGTAPSAAEYQQQQGLSSALRGQQALAASARGPAGLASAQYNAASNAGGMAQQGIAQAAQLRAQEMAQARDAYFQGASGIRGQDIQSGLGQGQLGLGYEGALGNANSAQLSAQANAAQLAQQKWQTQAAMDEAAARSQEGTIGSVLGGVSSSLGSFLSGKSPFSDVRLKTNIQPLEQGYGSLAGAASMAGMGNFDAPTPQTSRGLSSTIAGAQAFNPMDGSQYERSMTSDNRAKTSLIPQNAEPAQMMDHLHPYSYEYKPGTGLMPGRRYGIMAQDLEKTPMGASVVEETPQGKAIDVAQSTGLHFANEANLNQRLRALEMQMGKK